MTDNLHLLEKHFDTAFAAPDGVKKLRELILTLAMQGKLVPQDPNDEPASELLKKIEAEKQRSIQEGKLKKAKPLPEIKPEEIPYDLPEGWEWVRLGNISIFTNGFAFKSSLFQDSGIGIIRIGDISNEMVIKDRMKYIDPLYLDKVDLKFQVKFNDLLIAMSGATTGKLGFNTLEETFLLNQRVGKIDSIKVDKIYIFRFLSTQIQQHLTISAGSAIPNLSTEQINDTIIPLPPLAEQKRIVEKIDRLMAGCDELEQKRSLRDQKRLTVHTAAINRLLNSPEDDGRAWQFIAQNFKELYSTKENITELRKAILQLGVMGKLVPQDPNDEPASELLKAIEVEKERLIQDGKIKKSKPLPEIKPDEIPYDLPEGWEWVRLNDIGIWKSGTTPSRNNGSYYGGNIAWVKSGEVKQGRIFETDETITQEALRNCSLEINPVGSVLVAMYGANIGDVGILEIEATTNQAVCACQTYKSINNIFLSYLLTELKQNFVDQGAGAAQPNISRQKIIHTVFAIPPLEEQKRIVEKIDRLMDLCDRLEQHLEAATHQQTRLLEAVMALV